jgi:alkylated DNA repair protein alkB family protein 4
MDDCVPLPEALVRRPTPGAPGIFEFDPATQSAPGCPSFTGLRVIPDFLSTFQSRKLLEEVERDRFVRAQSGKLKQHYGAKVNFNKRRINTSAFLGLPRYAGALEARLQIEFAEQRVPIRADALEMRDALSAFETTDVFVLRYESDEASNLDFHIDDTFAYGEAILDVSLESDAVLTFIRDREPGNDAGPSECVRVGLAAGSAALLFGSARFAWQHAILAYDIEGRRTSITLRTLGESLRGTEGGRRVLEASTRTLP